MSEIIKWQSPSNIALVKYWGKHGMQLPNNPSLSLTLHKSYTEMSLNYEPSDGLNVELYFDNERNTRFEKRVSDFIGSVVDVFPFLLNHKIKIETTNSFPHSAGIASSASSMSALALCLCKLEEKVTGTEYDEAEFFRKASQVSRRGSGSAARSMYGAYTVWGKTSALADSSDLHAIPVPEVHEDFKLWRDAIMIVHSGVKNFSSTNGHKLMQDNPFSEVRYDIAFENVARMVDILKAGDIESFMDVTEKEALMLHAMMMTSGRGYFEMKPNSLNIMNEVRAFRRDSGLPVCFTLDAGPNVHILYPTSIKDQVIEFVEDRVAPYCENNYWIDDVIGSGPQKLLV